LEIESLIELIHRASTNLPADVESALRDARTHETPGSPAAGTLDAILEKIALAHANAAPICQDTGTPIFFVHHPQQMSTLDLSAQIEAAVTEATRVSTPRPNAVDPRQRASAIRRTRAFRVSRKRV
jgi:fumarate hydratase class I